MEGCVPLSDSKLDLMSTSSFTYTFYTFIYNMEWKVTILFCTLIVLSHIVISPEEKTLPNLLFNAT